MEDQQPTPISSSGPSSVPVLTKSSTDAQIIGNLEQRSIFDGPNRLSALCGPSESQIARIAHTCSRRLQWALCMAGMGLENIAFAHPTLTVLWYIVNAVSLESRHITSEHQGRATVSLDRAEVERSDRVSSAQMRHQEMQIPTNHLTHSLPIIATPIEKGSKNVPLVQPSQHGMQTSVEKQGGADNLCTQAASDGDPAEHIVPIQTFNTAETSLGGCVTNAGRDIIDNSITYSGIDDEALASMAFTAERLRKDFDDKVHGWLLAPDVSVNFNAARRKHQPETGSWFIDSTQFSQWKNKSENILCLYGPPGCGKTILCSTIIKDVIELCESRSLLGYAYFFFDNRNADQSLLTFENFLRSLLSQLSYRCGGIPAALEKIYHNHGDGRAQPSLESLNVTLRCVIEGFDHVYIMVDSLDECGDRAELLRWIQTAASWNSDKLHLLSTSRREPDIRSLLDNLARVCRVMVDGKFQKDILLYLDGQLRPMIHWDEKTRDLVKSIVGGRADGMFRWVALQIADLHQCLTLREVRKQLAALPKDLEETYERILTRSRRPRELRQMLHWLAFSARALSLEELADVVSVDLDADDGHSYDPDLKFGDPRSALTVCSGLVTESEDATEYGKRRSVVKLAHFSVKEFLISDRIRTGAAAGFVISERISHSVIAQICLASLARFDKLDSITDANKGCFALATYTAKYWSHHHRHAEYSRPSVARTLLLNLFSTPPNYTLVNWVRVDDPDHPWSYSDLKKSIDLIAHPLYYASLLGESTVVEHLLNTRLDPNILGGFHGTPLQAAAYGGHTAITDMLIQHSADVNTEAGIHRTALEAAVSRGHIGVTKLLLYQNATVTFRGELVPALPGESTEQFAHRLVNLQHLKIPHYSRYEASDGGSLPMDLTSEIKPDEHYFAYGAYADVYGGDWTDPSTGNVTRVAIKALRGVTDNEGQLVIIKRRLLREIRVWVPLKHPNITPFLGVMTGFGPLSAMVSPYYSKANVNQYTLDNPDADRLPLILGVARGLSYLHYLGLLHGDLKGHNVLIDDNLSPRLADFGRSRIVDRRGFTTAFTGTGRYMAPELTVISDDIPYPTPTTDSSEDDTLSSGPAILDPIITKKSDIYAFAMVVIEILTSKLPFFYLRQEHLVVILTQDGKRPDRVLCLPTHFADEIWQLMEDCWHHDPQARPEMDAAVLRLEKMQSNILRVAWEEGGAVPVSGSATQH